MEPVHLTLMAALRQRIQHRQHRRLPDTAGEQSDRRLRLNVKEEVPGRRRQIDHIAFAGMVMQPAGNLAAFFAFNRDAVALAVRFAGQGVLANFLIFEIFRLQPDGQILARLVIGDRLAVDRLELKAGDKLAARGFLHDAERAGPFPAAGFTGVLLIDLGFAADKDVRQHAVSFPPGIKDFLTRAEHFIEGRQQMAAHDVVLLRFDLETGVFLGDFFHRRQQGGQVIDIAGVGGNGVEQRFSLVAVALVAHIEDLFELRVMRKHTIVEMGG